MEKTIPNPTVRIGDEEFEAESATIKVEKPESEPVQSMDQALEELMRNRTHHIEVEMYKAAKEGKEALVYVESRQQIPSEPALTIKDKVAIVDVEKAENVQYVVKALENRFDRKPRIVWIPHFAVQIADYCDSFKDFEDEVNRKVHN